MLNLGAAALYPIPEQNSPNMYFLSEACDISLALGITR